MRYQAHRLPQRMLHTGAIGLVVARWIRSYAGCGRQSSASARERPTTPFLQPACPSNPSVSEPSRPPLAASATTVAVAATARLLHQEDLARLALHPVRPCCGSAVSPQARAGNRRRSTRPTSSQAQRLQAGGDVSRNACVQDIAPRVRARAGLMRMSKRPGEPLQVHCQLHGVSPLSN